jgi:hypothetical protein
MSPDLSTTSLVRGHLHAHARGHVEADRERVQVGQRLGRERRDAAGVHAAAEVRADRDVADELAPHGLPEEAVELVLVLPVRGGAGLLAELEVPVALRSRPAAVRSDGDVMTGPQQLDVGEQRAVGEDVLEREVLEQMRQAQARAERAVLEHRLDLRPEQEDRSEVGVVERLDAEAVTGEEQLGARAVPDREREHSVEALDARGPPLGVRVEHDLGVGVRAERATGRRQLLAQLDEVVDLAVVGDPVAAVARPHRHRARGRRVDDRQPAVDQPDRAVRVLAPSVRSAMGDHVAHPPQDLGRRRTARALEHARDAAHG